MATPSYSVAALLGGLGTKVLFASSVSHVVSVLPTLPTRDQQDGGGGRIVGTVKQVGTPNAPVWRRVRLFDRRSGRCLRETWSDPVTGAYEFANIALGREYTIVAYDHTGLYNAVIADPILAEAMP